MGRTIIKGQGLSFAQSSFAPACNALAELTHSVLVKIIATCQKKVGTTRLYRSLFHSCHLLSERRLNSNLILLSQNGLLLREALCDDLGRVNFRFGYASCDL
mmetsp:Transcript_6748/g.19108  ORF Transcript_6748/g.19108 Transcript_6748/m.19108 type:complete len:102 (-) Transcript_6748:41-346(-)